MKRVLMVSPHFPPDNGAATHRLRLLAPHLAEFGWVPTVVTVDPRDYEGELDPELLSLVPDDLDVVRVRAWSAKRTRRFGFGDLGIRAFTGLLRECRNRAIKQEFHCFFVTIYPTYPALLGPLVKKWTRVPFVLDYQDPWVSEWGRSTGPAANGRPDTRSRFSRLLAARLEPIAVAAADAITAVSHVTHEAVRERIPQARAKLYETIPVGGELSDFVYLRSRPRVNPFFDRSDGRFHLCYVGTLLPLGLPTLHSVMRAIARLKAEQQSLYRKLRIHFIGTSNQTAGDLKHRVISEAVKMGVEDAVQEFPPRAHYLDALNVLTQSDAILLMGSMERHYTASKLYPALLAQRPILALFHEESSVASILGRALRPPIGRLVIYGDRGPTSEHDEQVHQGLVSMMKHPVYDASAGDLSVVNEFSARALAGRLASVFTRVCLPR